MKKLILTTLAVSIAIISACTPTTTPSPTASVNGANPATSTTGKMNKAQVLKFMECLVAKAAPNDSKALKTVADSWTNMPEAAFDMALVPQIQYIAKANAALGCTL